MIQLALDDEETQRKTWRHEYKKPDIPSYPVENCEDKASILFRQEGIRELPAEGKRKYLFPCLICKTNHGMQVHLK